MLINIQNFIPSPLSETFSGSSDLWKNPNIAILESEIVSVISASGKGKSSLLNSIYGLRKDYEGSIQIDNRDISSFSPAEWSKLRTNKLSIVFQSLNLFPELSAIDNVLIKNKLSQFKSEENIRQLFMEFGIDAQINQAAAKLSFGQQQRVAIIRALCQPFEAILLDEPFSHLDKENAGIAWNAIKKESEKQGASILIAGLQEENFISATKTLNI